MDRAVSPISPNWQLLAHEHSSLRVPLDTRELPFSIGRNQVVQMSPLLQRSTFPSRRVCKLSLYLFDFEFMTTVCLQFTSSSPFHKVLTFFKSKIQHISTKTFPLTLSLFLAIKKTHQTLPLPSPNMAPHEVEIRDSEFAGISTVRHSRKTIDSILQVRGTEIVDGHGDPVILKGVGLSN